MFLLRSVLFEGGDDLTSESVEGASLSFEGVDDVHGSDGLPLGVFSVSDGISDHVLQEDLKDTSGFLVDEAGNTLHSTTTRQTTDGRLRDSLDVIAQNLPVPLCAPFPQSLPSLTATSHFYTSFERDFFYVIEFNRLFIRFFKFPDEGRVIVVFTFLYYVIVGGLICAEFRFLYGTNIPISMMNQGTYVVFSIILAAV